jgi:hypothetical protein
MDDSVYPLSIAYVQVIIPTIYLSNPYFHETRNQGNNNLLIELKHLDPIGYQQ